MISDKNTSVKYFKIIFENLEKKIFSVYGEINIARAAQFLKLIKNSKNYLQDIYLLSKTENLKHLAGYMLFIIKRIETGEINFENFTPNLEKDIEFIKKIIIDYFKLERANNESKEWWERLKNIHIEEPKQDEEIIFDITEKFTIEAKENEIVTEEFFEKNLETVDTTKEKQPYLQLIKNKESQENKKVFDLPGEEPETESMTQEPEQQSIAGKTTKPEDNKAYSFDDIDLKDIPGEETEEIKAKTNKIKREKPETKKQTQKEQKKKFKERPKEQLPLIEEQPEEQPEKPEETIYEKDSETISKKKQIQINKVYLKYETDLITRNALINTDFSEYEAIINSSTEIKRMEELINNIIENALYMEQESEKMSFNIITNIYGIIKTTFVSVKEKEYEIKKGELSILKKAILLIENLIKGDESAGDDLVIKETERIKLDILEIRKEKENLKKIEKDKLELEKHLNAKYSDTTQREKLLMLKQNILDVEAIFKSLEDIKSEYKKYDAQRKLSNTFIKFKEMVNISKILDLGKLARLSEASYVFIKFVQNYRLDPYDKDVQEILKFIVYNFKLIFLDKPTKDLEEFVSILNNPVTIFSKTKQKENNE